MVLFSKCTVKGVDVIPLRMENPSKPQNKLDRVVYIDGKAILRHKEELP